MITDEEAREYQDKLNECLNMLTGYCKSREDCIECPLETDACGMLPRD